MLKDVYDLVVIGGGINGVGIARDAAGRGLSVLLCEKGDLAEGTSSRSGKLIHGGLRYLEHFEFRLVREALKEREVLLQAAPHIVWPMRFVLPHGGGQRPAWLLRLGLFLYDHLYLRRHLPGSRSLDPARAPEGAPLQKRYRKAFEYSDCWVEDARLVVLNALDAAARGARVLPRTACVAARREEGLWRIELQEQGGARHRVSARSLVNAAGPWVDQVLAGVLGRSGPKRVRLVRGSHIVVRKHYAGSQAYLFQNDDRRVIFVNPYEGDYLLIGTTDIPHEEGPDRVEVSRAEVTYLCGVVNRWFERQIRPEDVLYSFSGVRPLYDDSRENPSAVTRDYVFDLEAGDGAPLLSIFGGKITTYRKLAEAALQRLRPFHPSMGGAWTAGVPLPGGDLPGADFDAFLAELRRRRPWLPEKMANRLARAYGTQVEELLGGAERMEDLGRHFGSGLTEREVDYLREREWAVTAEDILWRRSKLGMHLAPAEQASLIEWLEAGGDRQQRAGA